MRISFTILTHNRCDDLKDALRSIISQEYPDCEIIVVDNASTDDTEAVVQELLSPLDHVYIKLPENVGVSKGRNIAIENSVGDVLITIDDDALLKGDSAVMSIVEKFKEDPSIGILAFRIVHYESGELQKVAFPSRGKNRDSNQEFETSWFIGAGHAISRAVFNEAGLYRDFSPYGSEELDFSLRAIDAGFRIIYFPDVEVRHKISPTARIANWRLLAISLKNRIKAAALNLPWSSVLTYALVRSVQKLIQSRGNIFVVLFAFVWFLEDLPYIFRNRSRLSDEALVKLKELDGPLYF